MPYRLLDSAILQVLEGSNLIGNCLDEKCE